MAKRPKKPVEQQDDPPEMAGFPQHGDPAPEHGDPVDDDDELAGGNDPGDENDADDKPDALQARLDAQAREIEALKRQIPPAQPKPVDDKKVEEPDWENLLYKDPKAAMKLHAKMVKDEVTREIEGKYQREKGTEKFWSDFYNKHKDLKDDHDLVNVTLNSNLDTLANVPVAEAMDKLADLTRTRIMRYAGNKPTGKKVRVEGSDPPQPRRVEVPSDKPSSLSDIIKARKGNRRRATAA